jgi:hypothetical protein
MFFDMRLPISREETGALSPLLSMQQVASMLTPGHPNTGVDTDRPCMKELLVMSLRWQSGEFL